MYYGTFFQEALDYGQTDGFGAAWVSEFKYLGVVFGWGGFQWAFVLYWIFTGGGL